MLAPGVSVVWNVNELQALAPPPAVADTQPIAAPWEPLAVFPSHSRTVLSGGRLFLGTRAGHSAADWPPEGRLLCTNCRASGPAIAPDGASGAFISWVDRRNGLSGSNDDLYLQRVLPSGNLAPGWPADGLPVCTAPGNF